MATSTSSKPTLTLPASEHVAADGTIAITGANYTDSFAQTNAGSLYLTISDASGALYGYYPGAATTPGDGSDTISFQGSYADVQDIINSLTYVAAASTGSDAIHYDIWNQAGVETTGSVPVTVSGGTSGNSVVSNTGSTTANPSSGPALSEPASETVVAAGTVAVSGSYSDSVATGNPGAMFLSITDSSGTLRASNAEGAAVAGSGSDSITLNADYADVNAILQSLTYTAGPSTGSDSINFDLWNQAGVQTTDSVAVSIASAGSTQPAPLTESWTGAVSSAWNVAGNWSGDVVPASGDSVVISGNAANQPKLSNATLAGETITLEGSGSGAPNLIFNDVTLDSVLQSGNAGQLQIGGTLAIGAQGTLETDANATLTLTGTAETIVNNGVISSAPGGTLLIYNGPSGSANTSLINNGSIVVNGGNVNLPSGAPQAGTSPDWTMVNTGGIAITDGGDFTLNGSVQGGDIAFNGTGVLTLQQGMAFTDGAMVSGFGQGDQIALLGTPAGEDGVLSVVNGTLDLTQSGSLVQAIPLSGSYGLGNFEVHRVGGPGNAEGIVYAPAGGSSGTADPDIVAPGSASVAQGSTLALNDVSIDNLGTSGSLSIDAGTGTLYMNGASGSGTNQLTLGSTPAAQLNADLASLSYVPAAGATADTVSISASPAAPVSTERSIPISITSGAPTLNEPISETVATGGTVAVAGSYSDSFAAGHAGSLFLDISDSDGTLSATNAAGQTVAGSGTDSIALQTDYVDVNAILASLHYTAGGSAGSDSIRFDVWNQAGVETTASTAVTIGGSTANADILADFSTSGASSSGATLADSSTGSTGSTGLTDTVTHPIGIPLTLG